VGSALVALVLQDVRQRACGVAQPVHLHTFGPLSSSAHPFLFVLPSANVR
jgi:hypothetical protein